MKRKFVPAILFVVAVLFVPTQGVAQSEGPYARIAILRPHDGMTVEFEAGYIRHLAWHQKSGDPWVWYGWNVWASERQRWFIYATFGHSSASFDNPVDPVEDERDNVLNVIPHCTFMGNGFFEYLPDLSRGTGVPTPAARVEYLSVDLHPGTGEAFEAALRKGQSTLKEEALWFRMIAGGSIPRYIRLRPRLNVSMVLNESTQAIFPEEANRLIEIITVEILTLRPTMSLGLKK